MGGRAINLWDLRVLVVALSGVGVGVLGGTLAARVAAPYPSIISTAALWLGLVAAVLYAFLRSRPANLLTLKPQDLLWGVGLGVALRLIQGLASNVNSTAFPSAETSLDFGALALMSGALGPIVEEVFFRGVVLVVVYQLLRRSIGAASAATSAALFSSATFVLTHAAFQAISLVDGLGLFLLSMTCSGVVLLTGRLWGAVFAHVTYNAVFIAVGLLGTALA